MGMGYCKGGNTKSKSYKIIVEDIDIERLKWCPQCKQMLSLKNFNKDLRICKKCKRIVDQRTRNQYKEKNKDNILTTKTKFCYMCGHVKSINEFHRDKARKDGVSSKCKKCQKEYQKQWYQKLYDHNNL